MSSQLTTADNQKFIDASNAVYTRGVPSDLTLFDSSVNDSHGFYAEAFQDKVNGRIIIAFEGTSFSNNSTYSSGSVAADGDILAGIQPSNFTDADNFYKQVAAETTEPIYVTGHSLGGAEAQYVANNEPNVAGGITFGAPGLPNYFGGSTNSNASNFFNYVDNGDPVGNYSLDGEEELISLTGDHYGTVRAETNLVGEAFIAAGVTAAVAADLFGAEALAGVLAFGGTAAFLYHPLSNYASDLNLSLPTDSSPPTEPQSTLPVAIGGTATISTDFLLSTDPDNTSAELTYTVDAAPVHGTLLLNGTPTNSFTQADIDNGLVQYRENGDVATSDGFAFTVSDPAGNGIGPEPYTVAIVDTKAPVIAANATLSTSTGIPASIWKDSLSTVALGNDPADIKYSVVSAPTHGMLVVGDAPATSFTQADIDDALVHYFAGSDGANTDSFTFEATDAAGDHTPLTTFNIAIESAPVTQTDAGGQPYSAPVFDFSGISFGANTTVRYSANGNNTGGAISVSDGTHTANFALLGQYAAAGFATAPDPSGGTIVAYMPSRGSSDPILLTIAQH